MILQSLVDYYEYLLQNKPREIPRPGWCRKTISAMLELSQDGELVNVLLPEDKRGWTRIVPEQVKRSSGIAPNLLCDTSSYFLGIDGKGKPERAQKCFEAAKELHSRILEQIDSPASRAVCSFFNSWNPEQAEENAAVASNLDALIAGGSLVFRLTEGPRKEVLEDSAVREACNHFKNSIDDDAPVMCCLVTGRQTPIARLHPSIKGIPGTKSTGASLVSFNNSAFESYGHNGEQGFNAPVGKYAVFSYTTALNYLLEAENHHIRLGDTTVVFWALSHDEECSETIIDVFNPAPPNTTGSGEDQDRKLERILFALKEGKHVSDSLMDAPFFVLGLAPSAARLSIRFFWRGTFGTAIEHVAKHYERLRMVRPDYDVFEYLSPYWLLREIENPNSRKNSGVSSELGGALMRSILEDSPYPAALYENVLLRIRSSQNNKDRHTRKVTRGRAAIIKAYLLKNRKLDEEVITVEVNETSRNEAYRLGRLFAVLEAVQRSANPNLNSTISDRYLNSACATPNIVFPVLLRLYTAHVKKLKSTKPGLAVYYEKQVGELCGSIEKPQLGKLPKHLPLDDQGQFFLGYFQQEQSLYQKKTDQEA